MSGLRAQSPDLREDLPAGALSAGLTEADDPGVETFATSRVIFFCDAVLAIAITLLALGLPHTTGSTTNHQMVNALAANWDSYLAFVVSFAVIAMFALAIPVAFFTAWAFALWAAIPVLIRAERWRRAGGTPRNLLARIRLALRP